jgi:hypothetical protein
MLNLKELKVGRHHNSRPRWYARHQGRGGPAREKFFAKSFDARGFADIFLGAEDNRR